MDKQFCIFDMDGTLVDSMGYWKRAGREFLAQKGVTENVEPVLERIKPMSHDGVRRAVHRELLPPRYAGGHCSRNDAVMDEHYRRDVPLKPGAAAYVRALRSRGAGCAWPPPHRSLWPGCVWSAWAWQTSLRFFSAVTPWAAAKTARTSFWKRPPPGVRSGGPPAAL